MRKRTINHFFDTFMWYLIYLIPVFCYLIILCKTGSILPLSECMTNCGLGILTDNFVFTAFNSIFGADGVVPLFMSADLLLYFSYFICAYLAHLAVDVLLWIPRFCHKLMDNFGGKND